MLAHVPYPVVCAVLGAIIGWVPSFFHGPIPEKFSIFHLNGPVAVWAFYTARMLIGSLVGLAVWPRTWWVRGPLAGLFMIMPVGFISLATPGCGPPCCGWNLTTGAGVGLAVAALARWLTGRSGPLDLPER